MHLERTHVQIEEERARRRVSIRGTDVRSRLNGEETAGGNKKAR